MRIPHQAYILTNRNIDEFNAEKILSAYAKRLKQDLKNNVWELEIHPTDVCYLNCSSCSYANRRRSAIVNYKQLVKFVRYCELNDLKTVFFSGGGDPTNWGEWERFFDEFSYRKWRTGISTNLLNLDNIREVIGEIDFIQVHVVGYNDESVKMNTGVNLFEIMDRNLKFLFNNLRPSQKVTLKILLDNNAVAFLSGVLSYLKNFHADTIVIKLAQNFTKCVKSSVNVETVRNIIAKHSITKRYHYIIDNLSDEIDGMCPPSKCYIANSGLYALVRADGNVFPCIASAYDVRNALFNIGSDYNNFRTFKKQDYYDNLMVDKLCPVYACRHYRFNYIIDKFSDSNMTDCLFDYEPDLI